MWFLGGRIQLRHDRFALVLGSQVRLVKMVRNDRANTNCTLFCSLLCGLMICIVVLVLQQCKVRGVPTIQRKLISNAKW